MVKQKRAHDSQIVPQVELRWTDWDINKFYELMFLLCFLYSELHLYTICITNQAYQYI